MPKASGSCGGRLGGKRLRLAFAGSPELAAALLRDLVAAGDHDVAAAITQPDRRAGRGRALAAPAVKRCAAEHGIPVQQPESGAGIDVSLLAGCDLLIAAAYGLRLPLPVLQAPRFGCLNAHFSLLPRWRGADPLRCAIRAGDERSGVCIMRMEEGLDTGAVYAREACRLSAAETCTSLGEKLLPIAARLLRGILAEFSAGRVPQAIEQDHAHATYAAKLSADELWIDWRGDAASIDRQIRAFKSAPLARARLGGKLVKIIDASPVAAHGLRVPGKIIDWQGDGIEVACGTGNLRVHRLQMEGGKAMGSGDFVRGRPAWLKGIGAFESRGSS